MRAYVLHGIDDLRLEETALSEIKEREVLVKVMAAGICGSDIPRIYKTGTYSYPLIPGHEFSGTVIETGLKADKKWMGKRVGIFPLIPCGECEPCRKKQYEMCRHYSYLGSRTNGGFAEYVAVPGENLIELPEEVSYEVAAMLEPMAVAVHAMRKSGVMKENTVVYTVLELSDYCFVCFFWMQESEIFMQLAIRNFKRGWQIHLEFPKHIIVIAEHGRFRNGYRSRPEEEALMYSLNVWARMKQLQTQLAIQHLVEQYR